MILMTERLLLRPARRDDLAAMHDIMSRPPAMRFWSTPEHETLSETEAFLEATLTAANQRESDEFLIELNGRVIGKAGAWKLPEIGFILHPDFWRKGLVEEALRAVIPHLFSRHDMDALTAEVDPRNTASWRLLHRLGFAETHRASRTMQWREEWCDSIYLALRRDAYNSR